jgi:hypothetical protein
MVPGPYPDTLQCPKKDCYKDGVLKADGPQSKAAFEQRLHESAAVMLILLDQCHDLLTNGQDLYGQLNPEGKYHTLPERIALLRKTVREGL